MEGLTIAGWLIALGLGVALAWALQQKQRVEETLRQLSAHNQDLSRSVQRTIEDRDQTIKRIQREAEQRTRFGHEPLLRDILPVLDNLERALSIQDGPTDGLREGVRMICAQISNDLKRHGVTQIETEDIFFDPQRHEAVQSTPSAEHPPGKVLAQWQRGYLLYDRLLRPARVVVACEVTALPNSEIQPPPTAEDREE